MERARRGKRTKDGPGGDRLLIDPEGHLGKNDGHDAGCVYLYHEVAHLPLQVEIDCHYYVFTCWKTRKSVLLLLTVWKKNTAGDKWPKSLNKHGLEENDQRHILTSGGHADQQMIDTSAHCLGRGSLCRIHTKPLTPRIL